MGLSFQNFPKKGGRASDFPIKRKGLVKRGGTLSLICILTNPFQSCLSLSELGCVSLSEWGCVSLSEWGCVFSLFASYLLVFVLHEKNVVLLNLIDRYVASTSQEFLKSKDIVDLCTV